MDLKIVSVDDELKIQRIKIRWIDLEIHLGQ